MNVIKLYGGLGNQMFQYAFGKLMEVQYDRIVRYDISWFSKPQQDVIRLFQLNKFRTKLLSFPEGGMLPKTKISEGDQDYYMYNPQVLGLDNTYFFGYWQNRGYVEPILSILKEEFKVLNNLYTDTYIELKEQIISTESIGIHIRRGDYLTKGHHLLPISYYKEALSLIALELGTYQLFVFSDDIPWCKEQFPEAIFVNEVDYLSFDLLRLCKHKIVANSTFSWWASMIAKSGIIIAPIQWRLSDDQEERIKQQQLIPNTWIRI